jgi:thiol:disulfide interchange protein DsbD
MGFMFRLALACALWAGSPARAAGDFLPPEQAFAFSAATSGGELTLHWRIAPGYHLYRDRIQLRGGAPGALSLPPGTPWRDPAQDRNVMVYRDALDVRMPLPPRGNGPAPVIQWQGCADDGLCYPPASATLPVADAAPATAAPATAAPRKDAGTDGAVDAALASGNPLTIVAVFWLAGLLLSLTPCVLPMLPILSALIAGQHGTLSRRRGLQLAFSYALGMSLVYAMFGVAAGLAGEGLGAALQNRWVLGGFALLLAAMAMSMFGWYELQLPGALQERLTAWSQRFRGGRNGPVFLMGAVSALLVGPCIAAPLAGALVYIGRTGDVVLGGAALFALAQGMSVPLLLLGASAGALLPRAGRWMERVKHVFGMLLLGVAIWMVGPVLAAPLRMLLWAAWLLAGAGLLGLFGAATPVAAGARAAGAGLAAMALLLLVGAASGGDSVLQPLAHWRRGDAAAAPAAATFTPVASVAALDGALRQASAANQTVMLDFYADWCVACKELDENTFSAPAVRSRLAGMRLLRVDVTGNSATDQVLLKRFGLFGPPGVVFLSHEQVVDKLVGYRDSTGFLAALDRAAIQ